MSTQVYGYTLKAAEVEATVKVLTIAADLLDKGWMQGAFGATKDGKEITTCAELRSKHAVCFCSMGALDYATDEYERSVPEPVLTKAVSILSSKLQESGLRGIIQWNDAPHQTKERVVETFRQLAKEVQDAKEANYGCLPT